MFAACRAVAEDLASKRRGRKKTQEETIDDENTPTTTASDASDVANAEDVETEDTDSGISTTGDDEPIVRQLGPGLFRSDGSPVQQRSRATIDRPEDVAKEPRMSQVRSFPRLKFHKSRSTDSANDESVADAAATARSGAVAADADSDVPADVKGAGFLPQETLFVFDWDDTILPSSWLQRQGLRLDSGSVVSPWQMEQLADVAYAAVETIRLAKQRGTVVLLTNAERGWIELSCTKFLPMLLPTIENIKIVSARTTYESDYCTSPLDWKVLAFEAEIARACGAETLIDPTKRKNIHSLGDSVHEREALMRATCKLPNCRSKSLKFVERPDISDLLKQHALIAGCFDQIVQQDGDLDLSINCN